MPKKPGFTQRPDFAAVLRLAIHLIGSATKEHLAETARLLALNLAHYQIRFGDIPLENFEKLMQTQAMDDEAARHVAIGMENLLGVLGLVAAQDEAANDQTH